eukprot:15425957-Alexandrium_andersonii.AAC.1
MPVCDVGMPVCFLHARVSHLGVADWLARLIREGAGYIRQSGLVGLSSCGTSGKHYAGARPGCKV